MSTFDFTADELPLISVSAWICGLAGALFGFIDLGLLGAIVGLICGCLGGFLLGYCLSIVVELFLGTRGERIDHQGRKQLATSRQELISRFLWRVGQLAFMLALCHELYWGLHFQMLCTDYRISRTLATGLDEGIDRRFLGQELNRKRWLVELATVRPMRWWVQDDYLAANEATLDLLNVMAPHDPSRAQPAAPAEQEPDTKSAPTIDPQKFELQYVNYTQARPAFDIQGTEVSDLRDMTTALCEFAEIRLSEDLTRTLLLQFVSPDLILMKDGHSQAAGVR